MNSELQVLTVGVVFILAIIRIIDAFSGRTVADTAAAKAVTQLALTNNQERQFLQAQVSGLSDKVSFEQGKNTTADSKITGLEAQVRELSAAYEARIRDLEAEIKDLNKTIADLNKTIAARDETISELKSQVKTLSETVEKFLAAQAVVPPLPIPITETNNAAIAAESSNP